MAAYLQAQRAWLTVERLPGYAPDLNPTELVWGNVKGRELANLCADNLGEVEKSLHGPSARSTGAHAGVRVSPPCWPFFLTRVSLYYARLSRTSSPLPGRSLSSFPHRKVVKLKAQRVGKRLPGEVRIVRPGDRTGQCSGRKGHIRRMRARRRRIGPAIALRDFREPGAHLRGRGARMRLKVARGQPGHVGRGHTRPREIVVI